jgi:hypothetical protein
MTVALLCGHCGLPAITAYVLVTCTVCHKPLCVECRNVAGEFHIGAL